MISKTYPRMVRSCTRFASLALAFNWALLAGCSPRPMDPPSLPAISDVDIAQITYLEADAVGDLVGGSSVQLGRPEVASLLASFRAINNNFFDDIAKSTPQRCLIALSGKERPLIIARLGTDWITVFDDLHRAEDGFTLIGRDRRLTVAERLAFPCTPPHS